MSAESRDTHVPQVGDATEYRRLQRRSQVKPEGGEPWLSDQGLARLLVSSERMPQEKTTRMDTHVSAAGVGEECGAPGTRRHCLGGSTRQCSLKAFSNFAACLEYAILCAQTPNIALSDERFGCLEKPPDTVGELGSAEICVSHMPAWKAKKLGKLTQEKVLLER